ncbi:MAG: 50S ribosomal protein L23 [Patescibacteria group bacterium]
MIKAIPQISEKSLDLGKKNQYTFIVARKVNKTELKKEIEKKYKVDVLSVRSLNKIGKKKRVRHNKQTAKFGKRIDIKKILVTLKKGQQIKEFKIEDTDLNANPDAIKKNSESVKEKNLTLKSP